MHSKLRCSTSHYPIGKHPHNTFHGNTPTKRTPCSLRPGLPEHLTVPLQKPVFLLYIHEAWSVRSSLGCSSTSQRIARLMCWLLLLMHLANPTAHPACCADYLPILQGQGPRREGEGTCGAAGRSTGRQAQAAQQVGGKRRQRQQLSLVVASNLAVNAAQSAHSVASGQRQGVKWDCLLCCFKTDSTAV